MSGGKDLIMRQEYRGDDKSPLVTPASKLDILMMQTHEQIVNLNKNVKIIKEILEVINEK